MAARLKSGGEDTNQGSDGDREVSTALDRVVVLLMRNRRNWLRKSRNWEVFAKFDKSTVKAELDAQPNIVRFIHYNKLQPESKFRNDKNVFAFITGE